MRLFGGEPLGGAARAERACDCVLEAGCAALAGKKGIVLDQFSILFDYFFHGRRLKNDFARAFIFCGEPLGSRGGGGEAHFLTAFRHYTPRRKTFSKFGFLTREPPEDLGRIGGIRSHLVSSKSVVIGPIFDPFDLKHKTKTGLIGQSWV